MKDCSGELFIVQGSSIAGAIRNWVSTYYTEKQAVRIFGDREQEGQLIISDGIFDPEPTLSMRPRLRIDGRYGCAKDRTTFAVKHISAGSSFQFSVVWLGCEADKEDLDIVEKAFGAMNQGDICIGSHKSTGYGVLKLDVRKQEYHLKDEKEREYWLNDSDFGERMELSRESITDQVHFTVTGTIHDVLVKEGSQQRGQNHATVNIRENGTALIPGTSVKGALRSHSEMLADYLKVSRNIINHMFGNETQGSEPGCAGAIRFEDIELKNAKSQVVSRIRLNKFTGGVMRKALFSEEPVTAEMSMNIFAPNEPTVCLLLLWALRDLGLNLYGLGSGSSIGHGQMHVDKIEAHLPNGEMTGFTFDQSGNCEVWDENHILKQWKDAVRGETKCGMKN